LARKKGRKFSVKGKDMALLNFVAKKGGGGGYFPVGIKKRGGGEKFVDFSGKKENAQLLGELRNRRQEFAIVSLEEGGKVCEIRIPEEKKGGKDDRFRTEKCGTKANLFHCQYPREGKKKGESEASFLGPEREKSKKPVVRHARTIGKGGGERKGKEMDANHVPSKGEGDGVLRFEYTVVRGRKKRKRGCPNNIENGNLLGKGGRKSGVPVRICRRKGGKKKREEEKLFRGELSSRKGKKRKISGAHSNISASPRKKEKGWEGGFPQY